MDARHLDTEQAGDSHGAARAGGWDRRRAGRRRGRARRWARITPLALALALVMGLLSPTATRRVAADTGSCATGTGLLSTGLAAGQCAPPPLLNIPTQVPIYVGSGTPPPPPLYLATPTEAGALSDLESQAVTATIADHGLSSGDAVAVQSWGRADAEAELWSLLVQAIQTQPGARTADQQGAVAWLTDVLRREQAQAADQAGLEYVRWAGLDQAAYTATYNAFVAGQKTRDDLATALSGQPVSYNLIDSNGRAINPSCGPGCFDSTAAQRSTAGYCVYHPPAPYDTTDEYNGRSDQTCYTPCTNLVGCAAPTPSYDQFVTWGEADAQDGVVNTYGFGAAAAGIARGATLGASFAGAAAIGAAGAGTLAAGGTPLSALLTGSAFQNAVFPFAARVNQAAVSAAVAAAEAAGEDTAAAAAEVAEEAAASGGAVSAAGVASIAAIALAAIAIAVTQGIQVVDAAQLPGKLADLIAGAATATPDLQAALGDTNQAQGLYALFVGATLPTPTPGTCANTFLPADGGPTPCLNAPALPDPANPDPYFLVAPRSLIDAGTLSPADLTPTQAITWTDAAAGITTTARLHEAWFVEQVSAPGLPTTALQTLRLRYTDWAGGEQTAWLLATGGSYSFLTVADQPGAGASFNPATCLADGTCADTPTIDYVGPDGNDYRAQVLQAVPPVAAFTVGAHPTEGSPVALDASRSVSPLGLPLTYQWRFEQPQTSLLIGCVSSPLITCDPYADYTAPVSGTTPGDSYTWQRSGTYGVLLTVSDSLGKVSTVTGTVTVADVTPTLTLNPAAPAPAASPITLTGVITHAGSLDTESVTVDWGDGSGDANTFNDVSSFGLPSQSPLALTAIAGTLLGLSDTHTYAAPGVYTATIRTTDQAGATSVATATESIGQQAIAFAAPAAHTYGDAPFTVSATGGASGNPVTFTAGPSTVCASSGTNGATIALGGAGTCVVTASQAGNATYSAATPVQRSFTVTPATLTVTADDQAMPYGGAVPALTASDSGFKNGDTASVVSGAPRCTTTATSGSPSGGGSPARSYPITCSAGTLTARNYTFAFRPGTLTVNPAPLTITAGDQTAPYGRVPAYTWTGSGWANGESAATLATAPNSVPTCAATLNGATASATTPPGIYAGAITCRGAADTNYTITYASGTLTVDPLLSLDERGLPSTIPHRATLDGTTVTLPDATVEVPYGSRHSYSFPATVTDGSGAIYITTDAGYSGPVTANISDTATYQTMAQAISAALASGGIDNSGPANALTQQFAAVQADLQAGNMAQALADLHSFAAHVRAQAGQHLTAATAQALLAAAQTVYASLGGTGAV